MVTDREARGVLLVVEGAQASYARLVEVFGSTDLVLATTVAEARNRLEATTPSAMLLTRDLDDRTEALVEDVRAGRYGRPGLPIVVVVVGADDRERAAELGVDETVTAPVSPPALEDAVDRAVLLGRYKSAVREFFDACREQAVGDRAESPVAARREADAVLAEIHAHDAITLERLLDRP